MACVIPSVQNTIMRLIGDIDQIIGSRELFLLLILRSTVPLIWWNTGNAFNDSLTYYKFMEHKNTVPEK